MGRKSKELIGAEPFDHTHVGLRLQTVRNNTCMRAMARNEGKYLLGLLLCTGKMAETITMNKTAREIPLVCLSHRRRLCRDLLLFQPVQVHTMRRELPLIGKWKTPLLPKMATNR